MKKQSHQKLPHNWDEREHLRNKGQFWTPAWVAEAMMLYVSDQAQLVFDPAVGNGAFYQALQQLHLAHSISFYGTDIDDNVLNDDMFRNQTCHVEHRDFILNPPEQTFTAIIANPPYIRHHRLPERTKAKLRELSQRILGFSIDGRAGLHIFFLIQALDKLAHHGKLAFIMPADTCEGVFAKPLWQWITQHFRLECVVTFAPEATPFPDVDTNALIFFIKNEPPAREVCWVKVRESAANDLKAFVQSGFRSVETPSLEVMTRNLDEALQIGLSRPPRITQCAYTLSDFASVMRGIVTGANEFFFLTTQRAKELRIDPEFLKPAIGRTKDVDGAFITAESIHQLEQKGRPTLLFAPDGRKLQEFPENVQAYLRSGEESGLPQRELIKTRHPWYKMEQRVMPKFLFAYLGRRHARFIRNDAEVLPLTCFLCVFPHLQDDVFLMKLWQVLCHPETLENLAFVGKSYGSGAIKVEPRSLEMLPIPDYVVEKNGLAAYKGTRQMVLFG